MNWPNRLTVARLVATFVFLGLFTVSESPDGSHLLYWRIGFVLSIFAGVTDFLDGYLARKYELVTDFGRLMDPLADKIFVVAGFVVMTEHGLVPGWITCAILAREFAVTGLRQMAADQGIKVHVNALGKWKTSMQMLTLAFGGAMMVAWIPKALWGHAWIWDGYLWLIAALTIYSGMDYLIVNRKIYINKM